MQDYGRDPQYADASIDAMREQKLAVNSFLSFFLLYIYFLNLGITTLFNNENSFTFLNKKKGFSFYSYCKIN